MYAASDFVMNPNFSDFLVIHKNAGLITSYQRWRVAEAH